MIDWLQEESTPYFPNTNQAQLEPNGLLAAGGKLTPGWLFDAYRKGIFPWYDDESPILWWTPAPRMILKKADFHISKSLRKAMKKQDYKISVDLAFEEVIFQCALPREADDQGGTWITDDMQQAYCRMHDNGIAHSVEYWDCNGNLAGGLYGLLIGQVFYGESMFSRKNNASKLAFAHLARYLYAHGVQIIDCQMHSNHMAQFGANEVARKEFEDYLCFGNSESLAIKLPVFLKQ